MTLQCPVCGGVMVSRADETRLLDCDQCDSAATSNIGLSLVVANHKLANVHELLKQWTDRLQGPTHTEHPQTDPAMTILYAVQSLQKALES